MESYYFIWVLNLVVLNLKTKWLDDYGLIEKKFLERKWIIQLNVCSDRFICVNVLEKLYMYCY